MMNLTKSIVTAALAVATLGVMPATSAQAQTSLSISYRDSDYRNGDRYRDRYRDRYDNRRGHARRDRDRDGIPDRYDRYDNRRHWGSNDGYRYRDNRRCWTERRYDRWSHQRVRVRICR